MDYPFDVIRLNRKGHHYFSIIAWEGGFEFIFRNGFERWSTISPSLAKRIQTRNLEGRMGKSIAKTKKDFLELAALGASSADSNWIIAGPIHYQIKEIAIESERSVLDASWMKVKE
jgi:hypothetical protein